MNRTDRLLAIVLELQGKGRQRAEDLAETFETSKRTIYRDIQALGQAGVPLVSVPGRGYALMKGYFLPPLSFTTDEATMLLLGSDFMTQNFDAQYRAAAQSASRKIEGVLPEKLRDEVHYLQSSIRFVSRDTIENSPKASVLQQLRRAIIERTTVRFSYRTRYTDDEKSAQTTREADPYGLVHFSGTWHLVAYCHMRQGIRNFRLDRMDDLELLRAETSFPTPPNASPAPTAKIFSRPADFIMQERPIELRPILVRALFDKDVARWVKESPSYYVTSIEETPEGLLVTLRLRQESEILQWLLSWGQHVRVLEPESLRKRLVEEAEGMLRNHQNQV